MPRPADPGNAGHHLRQRRYRARLTERGRPEASAVDVAVAKAVAAAVSAAARGGRLDPRGILGMVMRDALRRLIAAGYDREESRTIMRRRLGRFAHRSPPDDETSG